MKCTIYAAPSFARQINEQQIRQLCEDLKVATTKTIPMIVDLLEGNAYKPMVFQDIRDHDYWGRLSKIKHEIEHTPSETEISCKKQKVDFFIELLDTNFDTNCY